MQRTPVVSSQITSIGYDPVGQVLEIEFPSRKEAPRGGEVGVGSVYQYTEVPQKVHEELMAAKSVGSHFGANIRGKFQYKKIEPETVDG